MAESGRRQRKLETLTETEFQILLALADCERHGYGIMQEVELRSQGRLRMGPGTLYGAIKRMLEGGVIEESAKRPAAKDDDDRRRCYYRLTRAGRAAAEREAARLADLVHVAQMKQLLTRWSPIPEGGI